MPVVRLRELAVELAARFGEPAVRGLVSEASNRDNRPGHRLSLLHALAQAGAVSDPALVMDLFTLLSDRNARIRAMVRRVIQSLEHDHRPGPE